jgi:protein phosphatase
MSRLVIISDVHADLPMLEAALAHADRLGVDRILCLGDLIDYGRFPEQTLARLAARKIPTIRGNHDRWAVTEGSDHAGWALSQAAFTFLTRLPATWRDTIEGLRVVAWHARPASDMNGIPTDAADHELEALLSAARADVLLVGHTHVPFARRTARGLVANPGALLADAPRHDHLPPGGGTFGLLDLPAMTFTVHRATDGAEVDVPRTPTPRPTGIILVGKKG